MFIDTERKEQVSKKLDITLAELKYMIEQTYGIAIHENVHTFFTMPGEENPAQPTITLTWNEEIKEKYSDLVLSKDCEEQVLKIYETVKDKFATPQEFVIHVLEEAMKNETKVDEELKISGGGGRDIL